jgi:para-nitrobenzyl esterase
MKFHSLSRVWRTALAAALITTLAACGGSDDNDGIFVSTNDGVVRAVERSQMNSYYGIPFAAPPTGNLRWTAPQAPARWGGVLYNTASRSPCLQTSASPFRLSGDSEDCLYLDVHAPKSGSNLPVMVWIHGGAFNTGGTATYNDPSPLVNQGVIVVNIAYRLGAMGFLGHPALLNNGQVGNYGVMDQQAALRWVRDNIARFGGDAANVTLFGESAGGFSVMTHLAAPASRGLFHKVIVQSGNYGNDRQPTSGALQTASTTVVNNTLADASITCDGGTVTAACLRALPDAVVRNQLATRFNAAFSSPVPAVDGTVLPKSIKQTFIDGENARVPVINGSNEDEYALFLAISEQGRRAAATPPNFDPAVTSFALQPAAYGATLASLSLGTGVSTTDLTTTHYPLANYGSNVALQPSLGATALGTDVIFACPALAVSNRVRTQASPIWMYEFRDQTALASTGINASTGAPTVTIPQGAAHSYEIQYLFNLRDLGNDERRALQTAMARYWTNFARTGNPNTGTTPSVAWPAFTGNGQSDILGFDVASGGGVQVLGTSFATAHKCTTVWPMITF